MKSPEKYPEGTFIVLGTLLFIPIGIGLSVTTGNMTLLGIGPALGLPMGLTWEEYQKKRGKIKNHESSARSHNPWKWTLILGLIFLLGILGVFIFF